MWRADQVYGMMINARKPARRHRASGQRPDRRCRAPAAIIEGAQRMGFNITHVGVWPDRNLRPGRRLRQAAGMGSPAHRPPQAARNGCQGVRYHMQEAITVLDPVSMEPVPWDGETMGEIMFRGNLVMKGYLKNERRPRSPSPAAGSHGDLAVVHSDGYVKIKDRSRT